MRVLWNQLDESMTRQRMLQFPAIEGPASIGSGPLPSTSLDD